jgi:hypothetical protein
MMQCWGGRKPLPRPYRAASSSIPWSQCRLSFFWQFLIGWNVERLDLEGESPSFWYLIFLQKNARDGGFCQTSGNRNLTEIPIFLPFDHTPSTLRGQGPTLLSSNASKSLVPPGLFFSGVWVPWIFHYFFICALSTTEDWLPWWDQPHDYRRNTISEGCLVLWQ